MYHANPELAYLCSERTIRRLIDRGELTVKSHELRRYVRFKRPQKRQVKIQLRDIEVLYGRQYEDFLKFVKRHKRMNIAQYDSVVGKRDDRQALLTIMFPKYNFQFGILIKKDNPNAVKSKIQALFRKLGDAGVKKIFPINIADNGPEFSYFNQIELNKAEQTICRTFFTRPYRSMTKLNVNEITRLFVTVCLKASH